MISPAVAENASEKPAINPESVLECFVGTWEREDDFNGKVSKSEVTMDWYLGKKYTIQKRANTCFIRGWDPTTKTIKDWEFVGGGGHWMTTYRITPSGQFSGEFFSLSGTASGYRPNGDRTTATITIAVHDRDHYTVEADFAVNDKPSATWKSKRTRKR
jgi:hypothetical protein